MKKAVLVVLLAIVFILTGCGNKEERVEARIEEVLNERYDARFEVQRIEYNVSYHFYEADVWAEELEEGKSVYVRYESKDKMYDDYYISRLCLDLSKQFEEKLDLAGDKYVFAHTMLTLAVPTFEELDYEESLEQHEVTADDVMIVLNYVPDEEEPEEILQAVIHAMEEMDESDLGVRICLTTADDMDSVKYIVNRYYNLDKYYENLDFYQEKAGIVVKEDGVITTTEEEKEEIMKEMIAIISQTL